MASDKLDRLVEKITQQQPQLSDDALTIWEKTRKSNQERLGKLKDALQRAVEEIQMRIRGSDEAAKWNDLAVRSLNSDTILIENPYIDCRMSLADDNTSIQGTIRAAKHLPDSNAVVETPIRIGLKTKSGKPSYSFGNTFTNLDSLAGELLNTIIDTFNQQPTVASEPAVNQDFDAEMKRGERAMKADWNRNLKARQKRMRNARAGR